MFYKKHIFFCCNQKSNGAGCGAYGGDDGFSFAKKYLKELGLHGEGKFRVSKSGCLGRCEDAPVCVIYPDGAWYSYVDEEDVREIIDKQMINNEMVTRLKI